MKVSPLARVVPHTIPTAERGSQKAGTGIWAKQCLWPQIDDQDLDWWLETAPTLKWKYARTYAKSAPHWYIQREAAYCSLTLQEYHRALAVIWTFGRIGHFYRSANVYLVDESRDWKFWATGRPDYGVALINTARVTLTYDA